MKKQKFSFAKWLTNRDIEKIVESLGLEIMTKKDDETKKRIMRYKDEDGYHITVFCRDIEKSKQGNEISGILMQSPAFRQLATSYLLIGSMFASTTDTAHSFFEANNTVMLKFDDFFLQECLSMKGQDESLEYDRHLTKVYQSYMIKKFGRHYTDMKRAHYKKLYQQYREEENNENEEL